VDIAKNKEKYTLTGIDVNELLTQLFASKHASIQQVIRDITPEVGKTVSTVVIPL
jgi:hypothetical protein